MQLNNFDFLAKLEKENSFETQQSFKKMAQKRKKMFKVTSFLLLDSEQIAQNLVAVRFHRRRPFRVIKMWLDISLL